MINIATMVRTVERAVRLAPIVKDLLPSNSKSESESGLLQIIKEKDRYIDNKKYDISKLREENTALKKKIELLQETIGGYQS